MADDNDEAGQIGLTEAIEALRASLEAAYLAGRAGRVRFRIEPVELTLQAGVTRAGKGSAGVKWHVLALGGEKSKESVSTQTLKLRLAPLLFGEQGAELPKGEQFISDEDDSPENRPPGNGAPGNDSAGDGSPGNDSPGDGSAGDGSPGDGSALAQSPGSGTGRPSHEPE